MFKGSITKRLKDVNQLPSNNGIPNTLSPSTLITGKPNPNFLEVITLNFGDYVQAYNAKNDGKDTIIYIDGAHAVHTECKGHSSMFVTQRKGTMMNISKKLGLATNSSTETEIVSTGERLPKCTWFRYFRIAQGEPIKENLLAQDNMSSMLQKNGDFYVGK